MKTEGDLKREKTYEGLTPDREYTLTNGRKIIMEVVRREEKDYERDLAEQMFYPKILDYLFEIGIHEHEGVGNVDIGFNYNLFSSIIAEREQRSFRGYDSEHNVVIKRAFYKGTSFDECENISLTICGSHGKIYNFQSIDKSRWVYSKMHLFSGKNNIPFNKVKKKINKYKRFLIDQSKLVIVYLLPNCYLDIDEECIKAYLDKLGKNIGIVVMSGFDYAFDKNFTDF